MKKFVSRVLVVLVVVVGLFYFVGPIEAQAAAFTMARIRYDRMKASTPTSLQITIVPATTATEDQIRIIFGSVVVGAGQSVTLTALPTGTTELPGTLTAVGSGTSITISGVGNLTVGTTYAFNLALAGTGLGVSNPVAGTTTDIIRTIGSSATIDQTSVASRYIANDQVVITANVPPTFTFSLSGNTDAFTADLGAGSTYSTAGIGLTVTTNAAKGWTGWVKSANAALSSVTTGESIGTSGTINAAAETCVAGTDCYVLDVGVTSGGAATVAAEYDGNGSSTGGTLTTVYQPFGSSSAKTGGDYFWFWAHATMIATKAAGNDYTDTWTIVGAGNF
jgi:hypothetical protein